MIGSCRHPWFRSSVSMLSYTLVTFHCEYFEAENHHRIQRLKWWRHRGSFHVPAKHLCCMGSFCSFSCLLGSLISDLFSFHGCFQFLSRFFFLPFGLHLGILSLQQQRLSLVLSHLRFTWKLLRLKFLGLLHSQGLLCKAVFFFNYFGRSLQSCLRCNLTMLPAQQQKTQQAVVAPSEVRQQLHALLLLVQVQHSTGWRWLSATGTAWHWWRRVVRLTRWRGLQQLCLPRNFMWKIRFQFDHLKDWKTFKSNQFSSFTFSYILNQLVLCEQWNQQVIQLDQPFSWVVLACLSPLVALSPPLLKDT